MDDILHIFGLRLTRKSEISLRKLLGDRSIVFPNLDTLSAEFCA